MEALQAVVELLYTLCALVFALSWWDLDRPARGYAKLGWLLLGVAGLCALVRVVCRSFIA